jgi:hypothetical protein
MQEEGDRLKMTKCTVKAGMLQELKSTVKRMHCQDSTCSQRLTADEIMACVRTALYEAVSEMGP